VTPTGIERTFDTAVLGSTGLRVGRLGVASSYGVPAQAVERAFEQGVNYFYWGSLRKAEFGEAIRHLAPQRDRFVLVLQSYSRIAKLAGWSIERALRELRLDHADILLLGLWNKPVSRRVLDAARKIRERGLVRYLAISSHNRKFLGELAAARAFDVIHFRYNAKHTGAEADIFPLLPAQNRPGMVSYTATSWKQLMNADEVPKGERVPAAADCYRFVLSRPEVDVCLTGPANAAQMEEALTALRQGPMAEGELAWMRRVGAAIKAK
jgi:aryl-alcohol dehydrogenase-like predicted oxidoreductase